MENNQLNQVANTVDVINKYKKEAIKKLLDELKILFKQKNINVTIDYPNSKFILSSKKLFSSSSSLLSSSGVNEVNKIADIFAQILPCFSFEPSYLKKSSIINNSKKAWDKLSKIAIQQKVTKCVISTYSLILDQNNQPLSRKYN